MKDASTIGSFVQAVHHAPINAELSNFIWN
jgi:hypothetical protein